MRIRIADSSANTYAKLLREVDTPNELATFSFEGSGSNMGWLISVDERVIFGDDNRLTGTTVVLPLAIY